MAAQDLVSGSEETDPLVCQPCSFDGKTKQAYGFCKNCEEHLCKGCYNAHCVPSVCRDHVLQDTASMPKERVISSDPLTEVCKDHRRVLEYYCKSDKQLLCLVCLNTRHKMCGDVTFISDAAKTILESHETTELRQEILDLLQKVEGNKTAIEGNKERIEDLKNEMKAHLRRAKKKIVKYFEKMEASIDQEIDFIAETDISRMDDLSYRCFLMESKLQEISKDLKEKVIRKQNNKLFVLMRKVEKKTSRFRSEIESVGLENGITQYSGLPYEELKRLKSIMAAFCKLDIKKHTEKITVTYVRDIHIKMPEDKEAGKVTGMVVTPREQLVICDWMNSSVKLIDTNYGRIISELALHSRPRDITLVPSYEFKKSKKTIHEIIITLPDSRRLQCATISGSKLSESNKEIVVRGKCYGIQSTKQSTLVVSYIDPAKIEVLSMDGTVLRKITADDSSMQPNGEPEHMALSPCGSIVYVSDQRARTVISFRVEDGQMMSILEGLDWPRGVAVDKFGFVYVCCLGKIQQINPTCYRAKQVLGEQDGVGDTQAIYYYTLKDQLYVASAGNVSIGVWQITNKD